MPASTLAGYLGRQKLLTTSTGTALSTTPVFIGIPPQTQNVIIMPRNFTTAVTVAVSMNPYVTILKTTDLCATAGNLTNISEVCQDADSSTVATLSSQPTLANGGAIFVGSVVPFSGIYVDVTLTNSGGGTPGMFYWNGTAWTNTGWTDNTSNLANDGTITGAVPTAWVPQTLPLIFGADYLWPAMNQKLYWLRWTTSVAYDASVTVAAVYAINEFTSATQELVTGQSFSTQINRAYNGGNISARTDAGTASLIVDGFLNG